MDDILIPTLPPLLPRTRPQCTHPHCTNNAVKSSVCIRHGATQPNCTFILESGQRCQTRAKQGGLCIRHGARVSIRYCSYEGCGNKSQREGLCKRHYSEVHGVSVHNANTERVKRQHKECSSEGCTRQAVRGGVCIRHGGTQAKRKLCSVEGCTRLARKGGVCTSHGAKQTRQRCKWAGCEKATSRRGMCVPHARMRDEMEGKDGDDNVDDSGQNETVPIVTCQLINEKSNIDETNDERSADDSKIESKENGSGHDETMPILCQVITEGNNNHDENNVEASVAGDMNCSEETINNEPEHEPDTEFDAGDADSLVNEEVGNDTATAGVAHSANSDDNNNNNSPPNNIKLQNLEYEEELKFLPPLRPGSKQKLRPKCKVKGCNTGAILVSVRLCVRHGGQDYVRPCTEEGCTKKSQGKSGLCRRHERMRDAAENGTCVEIPERKASTIDPNNRPKPVPHPTRKYCYLCSEEGCTKQSMGGGKCWTHGSKEKRKRKVCSEEGCDNLAIARGVCARHGARIRKCQSDGCDNPAVEGGVWCVDHGGEHCSHEGCTNQPIRKGVCELHRAKKPRAERVKAVCSHEGCTSLAWNKGLCQRHNGYICHHEGCTNLIQHGGLCKRHGAQKRQSEKVTCKEGGCESLAWVKGLCQRHSGYLCSHEGCTKLKQQGGVCVRHGAKGKKRLREKEACSHEGCTSRAWRKKLCQRHSGYICSYEGCTNLVQRGGLCLRHGAKKKGSATITEEVK